MYKVFDNIKFYSYKEFQESELYILEDWALWSDGKTEQEREDELEAIWDFTPWIKENN